MKELFFNAKEWKPNPACEENVTERTFIDCAFGDFKEVYTIGNWDTKGSYSEICSQEYHLDKDTQYRFSFWLNGGENDRKDEICKLSVIYDGDEESKDVFKLNRRYIKPQKTYRGWYLFEIPFTTGQNEVTQLRFSAQGAYTSLMHADAIQAYEALPEEPDEFEKIRPQRHNIVFEDGWPTDVWYATQNLKKPEQGKEETGREKEDRNDTGRTHTDEFKENAKKNAESFSEDIKRGTENFSESMKGFGKDMEAFGKKLRDKLKVHVSFHKDGAKVKRETQDETQAKEQDVVWTYSSGDMTAEEAAEAAREAAEEAAEAAREAAEEAEELHEEISNAMEELQDAFAEFEDAWAEMDAYDNEEAAKYKEEIKNRIQNMFS